MPVEARGRRLVRDGKPFFAVGVNYHPSDVGCRIWSDWREDRRRADMAAIAAAGLNTVRFFVFWRDVEPHEGRADAAVVDRIRRLVAIAGDHGLLCLPSLLTIFMNGELLDLSWRRGRSLWRDEAMVAAAEAHVHRVAAALAGLGNVLAYDLGDELLHVARAEASSLGRTDVAAWQRRLGGAVRSAHPGALVLQANEASVVTGPSPFGPSNLAGLDVAAVHGYPMWAPFAIESNACPEATCLTPFLVRAARAGVPVVVDELGAYGGGAEVSAGYLRATARATAAAGAAGVLVWSWQDVADRDEPYDARPNEAATGIVDVRARPKPALEELSRFAAEARDVWASADSTPAAVAVLTSGEPAATEGSYLDGDNGAAAAGAFYAHVLLTRAHLPFEFADAPMGHHRLAVCPSVTHATAAMLVGLAEYVVGGGTVLYSSGEALHGFGGEGLFGVTVEDFTAGGASHRSFAWDGATFTLRWPSSARPPVLAATTAEVLARFEDGSPAFTRRRLGLGCAYYLAAPLEAQLDEPGGVRRAPWERVYRYVADAAGVVPELDCDHPDVEVRIVRSCGAVYAMVVNHGPAPVDAVVVHRCDAETRTARLALEGKGARLLPIGALDTIGLERAS